jgi:hypothetical protein
MRDASGDHPPPESARINVCSCHEALSLPEIELMVRSRAREPDAAGGRS